MNYQSDDEFLRDMKVQPLGTPKRRLSSQQWIDKALSVEDVSYQHQSKAASEYLVEDMHAEIERLEERLRLRGIALSIAASLFIWWTLIEIIRMIYGFAQ